MKPAVFWRRRAASLRRGPWLTSAPGLCCSHYFLATLSVPLISVIHHFNYSLANMLFLCPFMFRLCQSWSITSGRKSCNPTISVSVNLWLWTSVDPLKTALRPFCFPSFPLLLSSTWLWPQLCRERGNSTEPADFTPSCSKADRPPVLICVVFYLLKTNER